MKFLLILLFVSQACIGQVYHRPFVNNWAVHTEYKNPWVGVHRSSGADTMRRKLFVAWVCDSVKRTVTLLGGTSDSVFHYDSVTSYHPIQHPDQTADGQFYYISRPAKRLLAYYPQRGIIVLLYPDHRTIYN